jgi:hypothetical protein
MDSQITVQFALGCRVLRGRAFQSSAYSYKVSTLWIYSAFEKNYEVLFCRRRIGIEPTRACSHSLTDGFEDRAVHQNRFASAICLLEVSHRLSLTSRDE